MDPAPVCLLLGEGLCKLGMRLPGAQGHPIDQGLYSAVVVFHIYFVYLMCIEVLLAYVSMYRLHA